MNDLLVRGYLPAVAIKIGAINDMVSEECLVKSCSDSLSLSKKKTFALYILYKYKYRKFSLFQAVLAASNKSGA